MPKSTLPTDAGYGGVHGDIVALLEASRRAAVRNVNALITTTYWAIGRRIVESEQAGQERAAYGEDLIKRLGSDLSHQFGRGFGWRNLTQMRGFHLTWPLGGILQTPSAEFLTTTTTTTTADLSTLAKSFPLPWSAYVRLLSVKRPEARAFYETEALRNGWSVRQLDRQINSQFYERIALSRHKAVMLDQAGTAQPDDAITPEQALRDPFILEFLNLKDEYAESDLEEALVRHLADFLLELGDDFAFIGRQRRLRLDDQWFRVDLLLFHRRLRCPQPARTGGTPACARGRIQAMRRCRRPITDNRPPWQSYPSPTPISPSATCRCWMAPISRLRPGSGSA